MINFYQKYRPNNLSNIIGQSHVTNILLKASANDQLATAYIFQGTRGIGKTSISKILAKAYNCLNKKNGDVCNQCTACTLINENKAQDVYELDAATNNGVDEIRRIIDAINYAPMNLAKKVYILDEAHMLSNGAWNALLKTLEEPPKHVAFIFATTEFHKIPLTVVSRCQSFNFKKLDKKDIVDVLKNVVKNEDIKIDDSAINKIADLASGSARDSLSILQQLSFDKNNKITIDKVDETFGLINLEMKLIFLKLFNEKNVKGIIDLLNDAETKGINFVLFIQDILAILIDVLVYEKTSNPILLKTLDEKQVNKLNLSNLNVLSLSESINQLLSSRITHNNIKESLLLMALSYFEKYGYETQNITKKNNNKIDVKLFDKNDSNETIKTEEKSGKFEEKQVRKVEQKQTKNKQENNDSNNLIEEKKFDDNLLKENLDKTTLIKTKKTNPDEVEFNKDAQKDEVVKAFNENRINEYLRAVAMSVFKNKKLSNSELKTNFIETQNKFKKGDNSENDLYDNIDLYLDQSALFMVTDKAAILLIEDDNVAEILNSQDYDNNRVLTINHIFKKEIYIFAITKEKLNKIFAEIQTIKDSDKINYYNNLYESLDVDILRRIKKQRNIVENIYDKLRKPE
ncbi:DNA polymerase III subunit gamma/tau [Mycoplasma bradburyae]|uniref:DNA polymerase III subunit gamma/tau n=1 Tax=Mycoplasma bradburyae TaxID=2963128 RepID=A0AAW6HQM5_9MOLU|nr:DNA polymerase III subunit gamma/tau [Mycoplasma bradburyae]MDC4183621.1 DNA polymerase III subunit gamma/tau [Mycoplasma bradburyae]